MPVSGRWVAQAIRCDDGRPNRLPTRMHQKRCPAFDAGAHQIDTALAIFPIPGHDVLQFLCRNSSPLFRKPVHFHEIRQYAQRPEIRRIAFLNRFKQALYRIRRVSAMGKDFLERIPARLEPSRLLAKSIDRLPSLARVALAASQIFLRATALFLDGLQLQLPLGERCGDILLEAKAAPDRRWRVPSSRVARVLSRSMPARYSSICAS